MKLDIIYNEDCIGKKGMYILPDKSIDMILCDLPYGTTACKWDTIIPFEPLWKEYKRIIKDRGVIVLTASQPFTTILIASNMKMFKYCWVWDKISKTGHLQVKKQPLKQTEDVCIFYKRLPIYNPQRIKGKMKLKGGKRKKYNGIYGNIKSIGIYKSVLYYPSNIIEISNNNNLKKQHPTQKPVALFEYLIKTYTNEGNIILDNCIGSGTTAVACVHLKRHYVGFDTSKKYCKVAKARLQVEKTLWDRKE